MREEINASQGVQYYLNFVDKHPSEQMLRALCYVCDNHRRNQMDFREKGIPKKSGLIKIGGFEILYKILRSKHSTTIKNRALIALSAACRENLANLNYLRQTVKFYYSIDLLTPNLGRYRLGDVISLC